MDIAQTGVDNREGRLVVGVMSKDNWAITLTTPPGTSPYHPRVAAVVDGIILSMGQDFAAVRYYRIQGGKMVPLNG